MPASDQHASRIASGLAAAGALVVLTTSLTAGNLAAVLFALWALVPWALLFLARRFLSSPWIAGGAGALALAGEVGIRAAVFLFPRGSTAGIALVFSPLLIGLALPVGAAVGFVLGRGWRAGGLLARSGIVVVSAAALGLVVLGLARPDLLPTAVARRHAALKRIGEPRVLSGGDAFERRVVSDRPAWHVVAELDGEPGDEIAVVRHRGAEFLDPLEFRTRGGAEFGETLRWNWFSTLARLDGRPVVVQTGGGYSQTEVRELDGSLIWRHRPEPTLPPSALRAADLDADGELEFYAAERAALVRLDKGGREIWRRPADRPRLVALVAPAEKAPAWVVGWAYRQAVSVWAANGDLLGEVTPPEGGAPVAVVDWPAQRALVFSESGGKRARGLGLDGESLFEIPLRGDFALATATAVRFSPAAPPHLVLTAAAPRDVERWRLAVLAPDRGIVYEEVLGRSVGVLKARTAGGREVLLLSGGGLSTLRPIGR